MARLIGATIPPERMEEARLAFTLEGPNKTCKRFGWSANTFRRLAKEQGWQSPRDVIESNYSKLSQEDLDQLLISEYHERGPTDIARQLGYSPEKIRKDAIRLGLDCEKGELMKYHEENLRVDYFKFCNPEVLYTLGYIWGDGATRLIYGTNHPSHLLLHCHEGDESIILGIRDRLGSKHKITRGLHRQVSGNLTPYCRIAISTRELVKCLIVDHGILPAKSKLDLPFPAHYPDDLLCHFIRGYFDADGSCGEYVYEHSTKRIISFQGTRRFVEGISLTLRTQIPRLNHYGVTQTTCGTWILQVQALEDIRKIRAWLYPEGTYPYLPRKKQTLDDLLNNYETNP